MGLGDTHGLSHVDLTHVSEKPHGNKKLFYVGKRGKHLLKRKIIDHRWYGTLTTDLIGHADRVAFILVYNFLQGCKW
jgi:hypothetical protein